MIDLPFLVVLYPFSVEVGQGEDRFTFLSCTTGKRT